MQNSLSKSSIATNRAIETLGGGVVILLTLLVCVPEIISLWPSWRSDPALSHSAFVPLIVIGLLWARRAELRVWPAATVQGLGALLISTLIYVGAVWADIDFLKPLALIGMLLAGIWYLGGNKNLRTTAGALGLLVFVIPWPTTLIDRLAFPLQLTSSSYAALFAGMLGVPIHREGVNISVVPNPDAAPIYQIVVAQQCSGLTSLMVLLLLGYLTAYFTPIKAYLRLLMVGAVVPLALFANSLRLTVILFAGAHSSPAAAKWIHDHEGPVLIFFCSMGLMGLRHLLITWQHSGSDKEDHSDDPIPLTDIERHIVARAPR